MTLRDRIFLQLTPAEREERERLYEEGRLSIKKIEEMVEKVLARKRAAYKPKAGPLIPKWLRPLCGARTRAGGICKANPVWDKKNDRPVNGRCRMHGGLSSGPKTVEGRLKSLANLRQYRGRG